MAESVVSAAVNVLIEKLISGDLIKFTQYERLDSQLTKLKNTLTMIHDMLADAGHKHTQRSVKSWLQDLQELAYDIDDILDDLATEAIKRKFKESHASTSRSRKLLPTFTSFTPHNISYGRNMSLKLDEITTKLDDLFERKNKLGLDVNVKVERSNTITRRYHQTSQHDVSKVLGLEGDKEKLLYKLLAMESSNHNVDVVSIVGLGGIGKTTLARLLYNDPHVRDHFQYRVWVCVTEEFDVFDISKAIYQAVAGEDKPFANLDLLHVALHQYLSGRRFLIVLDDVWNEDHQEWENLERILVGAGAYGSKILVTTRKTTVASVMNSDHTHILGFLPDEYALSLFAMYALHEHNFDRHPSLIPIAQGIINKCDGLPLALIALGRAFKAKGIGNHEWEELLKGEIWRSQDSIGIIPALKRSYHDLPSHLKQLFAYCSLFSKGYLFNKNELVLIWMAEGFLYQSHGNLSMEKLGCHYFDELQSRYFFQRSKDNELRYTMHYFMNDLAKSVAGEFFFMLDDKRDLNGRNEAFEKFRYFSLVGQRHAVYRKFKELHRSRCLRTFLVSDGSRYFNTLDNVLVKLLPRLQFLRVLSLTNYIISEVPQSISNLTHLRYLNFSLTNIKILPKQVGELYNLQSLLVRECRELSSLPFSFAKLINLRHFDIRGTPLLNKTPLGICGLKSLQTLSNVYIEENNGFKLSDLKDLRDLQGQLSIKGLEKVIDPQQAKDANLQQKDLDKLEIIWCDVFTDSRNSNTEYKVLEGLRPHCNLKELVISFYGGIEFPRWVRDLSFDQLTELTLEGCRRCTHLPRLGHLSSLRKLFVKSMYGVTTVDVKLPSLEYLKISDMQGLEKWSGSDCESSFPRLLKLCIKNCPKLAEVSIRLIPSLEVLVVKGCSEALFRTMVGLSSSILTFKMKDIKGLSRLQEEVLQHLRAVEYLRIEDCNELRYLWDLESEASRFVVSLQRLTISNCSNLNSFPHEHLQFLTSLEEIEISNCPNMDDSFPSGLWPPKLRMLKIGELKKPMSEWGLQYYPNSLVELHLYGKDSGVDSFAVEEDDHVTNTSSSSFLLPPSLTSLRIIDFKNVESLSEVLQHLTFLRKLDIWRCPDLRDVPQTTSYLTVHVSP